MSRKQIYMRPPIAERARALIDLRGFKGLSDLLATLVREEWERRNAGAPPASPLNDALHAAPTPKPGPVTYRSKSKRPKSK